VNCDSLRRVLPIRATFLIALIHGSAFGDVPITILHSFNPASGDARSNVPDKLESDGTALYGTSSSGGSSAPGGTAFRLNLDGSGYAILQNFSTSNKAGSQPESGLVYSGSVLYGTTTAFGTGSSFGTLYKMNTDGTGLTVIHSFSSTSTGSPAWGRVTIASSTIYGTTSSGGTGLGGTVFKLNSDGTGLTVLHNFDGRTTSGDGFDPVGNLVLSGSKLFGTLNSGGANSHGSLFSINTDGTGFTVLHSFSIATNDGENPNPHLIIAGTKLYGTCGLGGTGANGVVFSIGTDGTGFTVLHNFSLLGNGPTGPGGLAISGSTLYGTTGGGGAFGEGTVFSMGIDGSGFQVLHNFDASGNDAYDPGEMAMVGSNLYGVAGFGGAFDQGAIYSLAVPEPGAFWLSLGAFLVLALSWLCRTKKAVRTIY
jgi:uncharacterized repeat protein (TIGR03803 family)